MPTIFSGPGCGKNSSGSAGAWASHTAVCWSLAQFCPSFSCSAHKLERKKSRKFCPVYFIQGPESSQSWQRCPARVHILVTFQMTDGTSDPEDCTTLMLPGTEVPQAPGAEHIRNGFRSSHCSWAFTRPRSTLGRWSSLSHMLPALLPPAPISSQLDDCFSTTQEHPGSPEGFLFPGWLLVTGTHALKPLQGQLSKAQLLSLMWQFHSQD